MFYQHKSTHCRLFRLLQAQHYCTPCRRKLQSAVFNSVIYVDHNRVFDCYVRIVIVMLVNMILLSFLTTISVWYFS